MPFKDLLPNPLAVEVLEIETRRSYFVPMASTLELQK